MHAVTENMKVSQIEHVHHTQQKEKSLSEKVTKKPLK